MQESGCCLTTPAKPAWSGLGQRIVPALYWCSYKKTVGCSWQNKSEKTFYIFCFCLFLMFCFVLIFVKQTKNGAPSLIWNSTVTSWPRKHPSVSFEAFRMVNSPAICLIRRKGWKCRGICTLLGPPDQNPGSAPASGNKHVPQKDSSSFQHGRDSRHVKKLLKLQSESCTVSEQYFCSFKVQTVTQHLTFHTTHFLTLQRKKNRKSLGHGQETDNRTKHQKCHTLQFRSWVYIQDIYPRSPPHSQILFKSSHIYAFFEKINLLIHAMWCSRRQLKTFQFVKQLLHHLYGWTFYILLVFFWSCLHLSLQLCENNLRRGKEKNNCFGSPWSKSAWRVPFQTLYYEP